MLETYIAIIGGGIVNNKERINLSAYKNITDRLAIYSTFKIVVLLSRFVRHIS